MTDIPRRATQRTARLASLPLLPATGNGTASIGAVAHFERMTAPSVLLRENLRPTVIVTADHEGRDLGSVAGDVQDRLHLGLLRDRDV